MSIIMQNNGGGGKLLVRAAAGGGSSNPQFVTGVDDPTVSLLLHMNGTDGGTSFVDNGFYGYSVGASGAPFNTATTSTAQSKFGGSSGLFSHSGAKALRVDLAGNISPYVMGSGDFTLETWLYLNNMPSGEDYPYSYWLSSWGVHLNAIGCDWYIGSSLMSISVNVNGDFQVRAAHGITTGQWYHLAVSRHGNNYRGFVDGVQIGSTIVSSTNPTNPTEGYISIGVAEPNDNGAIMDGYMQDFRITKGLARYTANFTPPVALLSNGYDNSKLPSSPVVGQLVVSDNNIYVCTDAIGPVWKRASLVGI